MKRHPAFHDLSRDHHMLLLRAQELRRGTKDLNAIADRLVTRGALERHLEEEEQVLLPLLEQDREGRELASRLEDRNNLLRAACMGLRGPTGAAAAATSLHDHARWCEDELFPWLQAHLDESGLQAVGKQSTLARRRLGAPVGPGEACAL